MTKEIFKVQLPLASNAEKPGMLVYNRDRSIMLEQEIEPGITKRMLDGPGKVHSAKGFFWGVLEGGKVKLYEKASWQVW